MRYLLDPAWSSLTWFGSKRFLGITGIWCVKPARFLIGTAICILLHNYWVSKHRCTVYSANYKIRNKLQITTLPISLLLLSSGQKIQILSLSFALRKQRKGRYRVILSNLRNSKTTKKLWKTLFQENREHWQKLHLLCNTLHNFSLLTGLNIYFRLSHRNSDPLCLKLNPILIF